MTWGTPCRPTSRQGAFGTACGALAHRRAWHASHSSIMSYFLQDTIKSYLLLRVACSTSAAPMFIRRCHPLHDYVTFNLGVQHAGVVCRSKCDTRSRVPHATFSGHVGLRVHWAQTSSHGGRSVTMPFRPIRIPAALRGCHTSLTWHASGWVARPRRRASSASSRRRAPCITISRARWRTAHWSTHSLPLPTLSEVRGSEHAWVPAS